MNFKETDYVLNSERRRLALVIADVLSEAYDRMTDEMGLNYSVDDEVQARRKLLKLIGCENDQSNQDNNSKPRLTLR